MFKLSVKVEYGILAVLALSLHEDKAIIPLSARAISEKENLSIRFLEQAMNDLKERGVIESVRGPHGGYRLSKSPKEITLLDVILAIEGGRGQQGGRSRVFSEFLSKPTILHDVVEGIDTALENYLKAIDCDTLSRRAKAREASSALMFHI